MLTCECHTYTETAFPYRLKVLEQTEKSNQIQYWALSCFEKLGLVYQHTFKKETILVLLKMRHTIKPFSHCISELLCKLHTYCNCCSTKLVLYSKNCYAFYPKHWVHIICVHFCYSNQLGDPSNTKGSPIFTSQFGNTSGLDR